MQAGTIRPCASQSAGCNAEFRLTDLWALGPIAVPSGHADNAPIVRKLNPTKSTTRSSQPAFFAARPAAQAPGSIPIAIEGGFYGSQEEAHSTSVQAAV
jgi:hypothetical protein